MKDMKLISEYELNITLEGLDTANINISLKTVYMSGFVKTSSIIYLGE
jgi:hypothetical protein